MNNNTYRVFVTLGPVGTFIAAGRRSRDLWFGSQWLSRATERYAILLLDKARQSNSRFDTIELFHPTEKRLGTDDGELQDMRYQPYAAMVQNKVIASITLNENTVSETNIRSLLADCFTQLNHEFSQLIKQTIIDRGLVKLKLVEQGSFERQLSSIADGDFIQIYSGWHRIGYTGDTIDHSGENEHNQSVSPETAARNAAIGLATAAKNSRLFLRPKFSIAGRPKSDLDAGRDSILAEADNSGSDHAKSLASLRLRVGAREGEQLDAIGLARRLAVFKRRLSDRSDLPKLPFPALARVALDPYLIGASQDKQSKTILNGISELLQQMHDNVKSDSTEDQSNTLSRDSVFAIATPCYDPGYNRSGRNIFPWDSQILLRDGVQTAIAEFHRKTDEDTALSDWKELQQLVDKLHAKRTVPEPYYALIAFDGDEIGNTFKLLDDSKYQRLAGCLDKFAETAALAFDDAKVHGCPFYVGGDEGLAFVPLSSLTHTIERINTIFNDSLKLWRSEVDQQLLDNTRFEATDGLRSTDWHNLKSLLDKLSLSFGVAVVHIKYDLRRARRVANRALSNAKYRRHQYLVQQQRQQESFTPSGWVEIQHFPRGGNCRTSSGRLPGPADNNADSSSVPAILPLLSSLVTICSYGALSLSTAQDLLVLTGRAENNKDKINNLTQIASLAAALPWQKIRRSQGKSAPDVDVQRALFEETRNWQPNSEKTSEESTVKRIENFANLLILAEQIKRVNQQSKVDSHQSATVVKS